MPAPSAPPRNDNLKALAVFQVEVYCPKCANVMYGVQGVFICVYDSCPLNGREFKISRPSTQVELVEHAERPIAHESIPGQTVFVSEDDS